VAVANVDTGIKRETSTNDQGYYTFALLNPGTYELTVQKTGFKGVTRPGIKLDVSQIARVDLSLTLGELKDSVTVIAEAPILTSENATIGQVIANKKILDLPLNGRDFTQLCDAGSGRNQPRDQTRHSRRPPSALMVHETAKRYSWWTAAV